MANKTITVDLTVPANWKKDWQTAICHKAARAIGVNLTVTRHSIPQQDCADPARTYLVLSDSLGAVRATYYTSTDSEHTSFEITKVNTTAQEIEEHIAAYC